MNPYRTHNCGELRPSHANREVRLAGWVDTIRDHGGVLFIDLRDHYGVTQIVLNTPIKELSRETVISVSGLLREREPNTVDPLIETGEVEVKAEEITILSRPLRPIPFEIGGSLETREEVRLKYRFLDLRNPAVHQNIVLRSKVISFLRAQMERMGFMEIQTPILTSSSPEGARDYLVPSRKFKGRFYALPQAPQIFKQLLMTSGFDKYFQIAPCFRDEDARADRAPGEFYQLDFEMAFATQEEVLSVAEKALYHTFTEFGEDRAVTPLPFPRLTYEESIRKYGTDKPDLRNPLIISDLTDFFSDVNFAPFKGRPVRGIAAPGSASKPRSFFDRMLEYATSIGMKGLGYISVHEDMSLKGPIVKFLSEDKQREMLSRLDLKPDDTLFFISDKPGAVDKLAGQLRSELGSRLDLIDNSAFGFCFIVDFPMYGINGDSGETEFTHNPFSMPQGGLEALETREPLEILAYQYDVVCNGVELSSGAVRNHRPDIMIKAFEIAGYTKADIENKFPALFEA
ncbi:MAG: aspartate--tRNA ligase, partial [Clostridiales bacterium]|nr:aspartate--tRNA ligase [Clostridiales bacterium]